MKVQAGQSGSELRFDEKPRLENRSTGQGRRNSGSFRQDALLLDAAHDTLVLRVLSILVQQVVQVWDSSQKSGSQPEKNHQAGSARLRVCEPYPVPHGSQVWWLGRGSQ